MEQEIVGGAIGPNGKYDLAFKDGHLVAEVDYNAGLLSAGMVVKFSADAVIDAIEKAIPGKLDDAVLELLRAALKK